MRPISCRWSELTGRPLQTDFSRRRRRNEQALSPPLLSLDRWPWTTAMYRKGSFALRPGSDRRSSRDQNLGRGTCCLPDPKSAADQRDKRRAPIMTDRRILIVAHRTAASPKLLAAVAERAARGPCMFTLLIPRPYFDPDTEEAAITLELAIPLLDAAAGSHVQGIVGATDPYEAVRQPLERET